jgi:hypothetical protein
MSLCQSSVYSCGACCGLNNLKINSQERIELLKKRTTIFKDNVDFEKKWTFAEYRRKREESEKIFLREDDQIYVCPFLGFLEKSNTRIGCMIHPEITKDPLSQNFSFYGASICQGYDCKNKSNDSSFQLQRVLNRLCKDSIEYSNLASDHIFFGLVVEYFKSKNISITDSEDLLLELYKNRLEFLKRNNQLDKTSFEFVHTADEIEIEDYLDSNFN